MKKFMVGDLVRVRSGGPMMKISAIEGENAECEWIDRGGKKQDSFYAATLVNESHKANQYADRVAIDEVATTEESRLLIATSDESDSLLHHTVPEMLKHLQVELGMDVVFVSEFVGEEHVFKKVVASGDAAMTFQEGTSRPLEGTWCKKVVEGRLPNVIPDFTKLTDSAGLPPEAVAAGSYIGTPIILDDGRVYGTICGFSTSPHQELAEKELKVLQFAAKVTAASIKQIPKNSRRGGASDSMLRRRSTDQ